MRESSRPPSWAVARSGAIAIADPDLQELLPRLRLGPRLAGHARHPQDPLPGVDQNGDSAPLAHGNAGFTQQLLQLLRPVGEADAVSGAPAADAEGEGEPCERER